MCCCFRVSSIMSTCSHSSYLMFLVFYVLTRDCGPCSYYCMSAWRTTSMSSSASRNRRLANFLEELANVGNHSKSSWQVHITKLLGYSYSRSNSTAHTASINALWKISRFCSALVSVREQYRSGCAMLSFINVAVHVLLKSRTRRGHLWFDPFSVGVLVSACSSVVS